jgi:hypothetical protein
MSVHTENLNIAASDIFGADCPMTLSGNRVGMDPGKITPKVVEVEQAEKSKVEEVRTGIMWPVGFGLQKPAAADGWVVQHVRVRGRTWVAQPPAPTQFFPHQMRLADGSLRTLPSFEYWEAWPVHQNETAPRMPSKGALQPLKTGAPLTHDTYVIVPETAEEEAATYETIVLGWVGFFHGKLPANFQTDRGDTPADLPSTLVKPSFWPADETVLTPHHLYVNRSGSNVRVASNLDADAVPPLVRKLWSVVTAQEELFRDW